jgi:broad-specificity NMP kinase
MSMLVTGTPGSGKTTLTRYARSVGNTRFFDADEIAKLCEWREFDTGKVLGYVTEQEETGLDDWYKKYGWYWRTDAMRSFLADHPDAILCGSAENVADYYSLFNKVVILKKTEKELLANLASPDRNNPFGKTPEQRRGFMDWQGYLIAEAKRFHPVILEGNGITKIYHAISSEITKSVH